MSKTARLKMELWCAGLDRPEFDCFPTHADFLLTAEDELDSDTVAAFKEHLQGLHSQLGKYFPELDADLEWIRSPFGDKTHLEHVCCKLPPRHVWQPCGHHQMGHWRRLSKKRVWQTFRSTSNLSILSWLTLLWNCWCHSQPPVTVKLDFPHLLVWKQSSATGSMWTLIWD